MIVQKDFINRIKSFGLNSYEAKLWTALLSRGISTAGELSDISNVPRSRTYDVLESLEKKSFIIMKIGKPIKYIAIDPDEVLERVKKSIKDEADRNMDVMDKLKDDDVLKELTLLHKQGVELVDPSDLSGSFKGRNNVYNQMETMIKTAESSIIIMTTEEGLKRKAELFKNHLKKAHKRGVSIKIAAPITPNNQNEANFLSEISELKHVDKINARFCLVDGKELAFLLMGENIDPSFDTGVWVNTSFFASAVQDMFDEVWKQHKVRVSN
ncbi:TrmB family transcriptional regulator [Candidatus Woesearchaeota archaeon]|nr:TrmB family transcriptional regulator [Candidatus Woesearchaeota archaeon]